MFPVPVQELAPKSVFQIPSDHNATSVPFPGRGSFLLTGTFYSYKLKIELTRQAFSEWFSSNSQKDSGPFFCIYLS